MKRKRKISIIYFIIMILFMQSCPGVVFADNIDDKPIMVSMGDSFSAGESIDPYYGQYIEILGGKYENIDKYSNPDWLAHRSEKSWPGMLTLPNVNGIMAENKDVNWYFVAASGAKTEHIQNVFYKPYENKFTGLSGIGELEPQINIFDKLDYGSVDYVTLTLGGNDAEFVGVVKAAATNFMDPNMLSAKLNGVWKRFESEIRTNIKNAYKDIAQKAGPQAHIIVAGYPHLIADDVVDLLFSRDDAKQINDAITNFNIQIEHIVRLCSYSGMDIHFVPVIEAFKLHEAYSQFPYIEPVHLLAKDEDLESGISSSSIHPNINGAMAYAASVQQKINQIEGESEGTHSMEAMLTVNDRNGEPYDNYSVYVTGQKYKGVFKSGLFKEEYSLELNIDNDKPVDLNLPKGDYTIVVFDNANENLTVSRKVKIRSDNKNHEILIPTDFGGIDFRMSTQCEITVLKNNGDICDDYSMNISGKSKDEDGNYTVPLYEEHVIEPVTLASGLVLNHRPWMLKLPEGEYNLLLTDGKDGAKTKSIDILVEEGGKKKVTFNTNFGMKKGDDMPKDAKEYEGNNHFYCIYKLDAIRDYESAQDFCEGRGGYLATITSQGENDFLYNYIKEKGYTGAYFGYSDMNKEGLWEWSNGETSSYTNWHSGEPNGEKSNEDYAEFYYQFTDGTWNDGDFTSKVFICEWGEYEVGKDDNKAPTDSDKSQNNTPGSASEKRDVVLVLDVSGSMSGTPMEETKKAALNFVDTIAAESTRVGIVAYDSSADTISNFTSDKQSLKNAITNLGSGGGTNIDAGLSSAQSMLDSSMAKKKIIVLMSDGEPNDGRVGEELISYADEIKADGIYIYTLGFFEALGSDKSSAQYLMEEIASDGCHYEVSNAEDLVFFFGDIADQISGQKYIYIRIACPVEVSVVHGGQVLNSNEQYLSTRTDFGTLTFEENENISERNTDDRIKILRLKEGIDYDVKIVGTGRGMMNYTIGFMDDDGEYTDQREFRNVKITRDTVIDTKAEVSEQTSLNIDEDGDGKYDVKYVAKENRQGVEVKATLEDYLWFILPVFALIIICLCLAIFIIKRNKKK